MNLKELFEKAMDFIETHSKSIVRISLSILGLIALLIVLLLNNNPGVRNEAATLVNNIENRQYSIALDYYDNLEKKFSKSKMNRFNKVVSKKINKLLITSGDKYIQGQVSKEQFINLVNTINSLDKVEIKLDDIIDQAKRVSDVYKKEKIDYDMAISYINSVSILKNVGKEIDKYKKNIETFHESREVYKNGVENQKTYNYVEAIEEYEKVLKEDKKTYDLAQKAKEECIDEMYDYYIKRAKETNISGDYEGALEYIEYLKTYYSDDTDVQTLEKEYQKNLSLYTLTNEDILNIVSKESNTEKNKLSITSLPQMINDNKYYYVEVYEGDELINEALISAQTKNLYSYKYGKKDYNIPYGKGYFMIDENGNFKFSINEGDAIILLKNRLDEKKNEYKKVEIVDQNKANSYIDNDKKIEGILGDKENIYYLAVANQGFFKKKEIYAINIYTKQVYSISNGKLSKY
ncbi:UbiD family decarboxylase [Metaclostridioides mangenotii]|uniref:UbiD family decarboxylase n=1 Tax=Metaclostridioides mangenotii TaxID=1540 RepID=UPI0026EF5A26|nr:UbiD family decarboxylase [Clostridioides mangenotii]